MIWCTLLKPSLDIVFRVNELKTGKNQIDAECVQIPAGKGLIVAGIIRALGEETGVIGLLPEYDGRRITELLDKNGIMHRFLNVEGGLQFNATIVEESSGNATKISTLSPSIPSRIWHDFVTFAVGQMQQGDFWCFSGGVPGGFTDDIYYELIKHGSVAGIKSLLDSRGSLLKRGVRARPLVVKPNLNELEEYFGEQIQGVHHIALKGKRFLDMGIKYVFISLGSDGMIALHRNDCLLCSTPGITATDDAAGCGDALVAGVLVALKRRFSFTETCRLAVACGSAKAMRHGYEMIDGTTVWQLMEEVKVTSI